MNSYIMLGHNCNFVYNDIRADGSREIKMDVQTMPEDCVLVTGTLCGVLNSLQNTPQMCQLMMKIMNEDAYNDPIHNVRETENIAPAVFGEEEGQQHPLHIHYSDSPNESRRTYTNGNFIPAIYINSRYTVWSTFYRSGVYNRHEANAVIMDEDEDCVQNFFDFNREGIEKAYRGSIYPTVDRVLDIYDRFISDESGHENSQANREAFIGALEREFMITQSDLFARFPGVYYNLLCRKPCRIGENLASDEEAEPTLVLRRAHSAQQAGRTRKRNGKHKNKTRTKKTRTKKTNRRVRKTKRRIKNRKNIRKRRRKNKL